MHDWVIIFYYPSCFCTGYIILGLRFCFELWTIAYQTPDHERGFRLCLIMRQVFGIWNICGGSIFAIPYTKKPLLHCVLFLERNQYSLYIALSIQHLISKSRFEIVKCVYGGNSTAQSYNFHSINHNWEGFNRQLSLYILFPLDDVVNILEWI